MRRVALAIVALALAAFLAVLAVDVLRVEQRLGTDDVRFQRSPSEAALWRVDGILPGDLAWKGLQVSDDVQYRSAVRFFRLSGLRSRSRTFEQGALQQAAELELSRVGRSDLNRSQRSSAANLRGVLSLVEAATSDTPGQFLQRSLAEFREAIRLDGRNDDAKYNLELVLQITAETSSDSDEGGGGARGDTPASGAGAASVGTGY